MLINFKTHNETNTDPLPNEFVIMLKEMFRDMSNHTISNKITPPENLRIKFQEESYQHQLNLPCALEQQTKNLIYNIQMYCLCA